MTDAVHAGMPPRIYLAGPTVFRPDARAEGDRLKAICAFYGCDGLFPLDGDLTLPTGGIQACNIIFQFCLGMLRSADAVVADLSGFRGPHCDDGTALEIGVAVERGLAIYGYAHDLRPLTDRISHMADAAGVARDENGLEVESFGQPFNAMIVGAVIAVFGSAEEAIAAAGAKTTQTSSRSPSA